MALQESLYWIMLLLEVVVVVMMGVELLMVVEVGVVKFEQRPVVTQPVLGGLGQCLKHAPSSCHPPLSLHELCNGRTVLKLVRQLMERVPTLFPFHRPHSCIYTSSGGDISARVERILVGQCAGNRWADNFSC